jgi:hypothetical protein
MENILVIASEESVVHSQSTTMRIEEDEAKQVGISSWRYESGLGSSPRRN